MERRLIILGLVCSWLISAITLVFSGLIICNAKANSDINHNCDSKGIALMVIAIITFIFMMCGMILKTLTSGDKYNEQTDSEIDICAKIIYVIIGILLSIPLVYSGTWTLASIFGLWLVISIQIGMIPQEVASHAALQREQDPQCVSTLLDN